MEPSFAALGLPRCFGIDQRRGYAMRVDRQSCPAATPRSARGSARAKRATLSRHLPRSRVERFLTIFTPTPCDHREAVVIMELVEQAGGLKYSDQAHDRAEGCSEVKSGTGRVMCRRSVGSVGTVRRTTPVNPDDEHQWNSGVANRRPPTWVKKFIAVRRVETGDEFPRPVMMRFSSGRTWSSDGWSLTPWMKNRKRAEEEQGSVSAAHSPDADHQVAEDQRPDSRTARGAGNLAARRRTQLDSDDGRRCRPNGALRASQMAKNCRGAMPRRGAGVLWRRRYLTSADRPGGGVQPARWEMPRRHRRAGSRVTPSARRPMRPADLGVHQRAARRRQRG